SDNPTAGPSAARSGRQGRPVATLEGRIRSKVRPLPAGQPTVVRRPPLMTQARTSAGQNFQDNILGTLRDRGQPVTLYLKSRLSVRGRVMDFDPYVVLVQPQDTGPLQMVYKSAIVSMSYPPARPARGPRPGGRPPFREGGRPPYREGGRPPYREGERPPY